MNILKLSGLCFSTLGLMSMATFAQHDAKEITKSVLTYFKNQQFDKVYNMQDATMKRYMDADRLDMTWNGLIENYDSLQSIHETIITQKDSSTITETKIDFVKKSFLFKLTINNNGELSGMYFLNTKLKYTPPDYINTLNFIETKIAVPTKNISSEGVLSLPKGKLNVPLVIIVGGSGGTDKDGTVGPNKPYNDIAWALAAQGVAVYRYDKRTANPENLKGIKNPNDFLLYQEYVEDVKNIVDLFSEDKRINPKQIFVAGHSQGGFMLPYFVKVCPKIKGVISLAGNYANVVDLMAYQFEYLKQFLPDSASKQAYDVMIKKAEYTKRNVSSTQINKDSMIPGLTMPYVKDMMANGPEKLHAVLHKKPALFIQGERDYQVPMREFELWKQAMQKSCCATFISYPKLNHLLMEGEGISKPAEYKKPNNVPEYVANEIAKWVKQQNK
jgi:dienelactone hydrolase